MEFCDIRLGPLDQYADHFQKLGDVPQCCSLQLAWLVHGFIEYSQRSLRRFACSGERVEKAAPVKLLKCCRLCGPQMSHELFPRANENAEDRAVKLRLHYKHMGKNGVRSQPSAGTGKL